YSLLGIHRRHRLPVRPVSALTRSVAISGRASWSEEADPCVESHRRFRPPRDAPPFFQAVHLGSKSSQLARGASPQGDTFVDSGSHASKIASDWYATNAIV